MKTVLIRIALIGCCLLACSTLAWACNVPVFRYALDHWSPDAYRAVVVHRAPLSAADQATIEQLRQLANDRKLNLTFHELDLAKRPELQVAPRLDEETLMQGAFMMVHYPDGLRIAEPVVAASLRSLDVKQLMDSPLRQELRQRLADGQSAVWLFVASGNQAADLSAKTVLESELRGLQSTLELPKLTDDPEDAIKGGPALRVEFSVLEVRHDDDREWCLRSCLLGSEPDLKELKEPMAFPVFGRGRALWPLVGAGINAENVRESATFVAGACSCQVKEQNPGFDLLLNVDWEELLPWTKGLEGSHNLGQSVQAAETVPIPKGSNMSNELIAMGVSSANAAPAASPPASASSGNLTMIVIAVVAVAIIALLGYLLTRSKKAVA